MTGWVDAKGRAIVEIAVRAMLHSPERHVEAWIDTGFTGELLMPPSTIVQLGLQHSGTIRGILADGSSIEMDAYTCVVDWFGKDVYIDVLSGGGPLPLIGVGLLLARKLTVDYPASGVSLA